MSLTRHTRESIIQTLQNRARELGQDTLRKADLQGIIAVSSVSCHFGSLGAALEAAGLCRRDSAEHLRNRGPVLSDDDLFSSIADLEARLGRQPKYNEYNAHGRYSSTPFQERFGKWAEVLAYYRKWRAENPGLLVTGNCVVSPENARAEIEERPQSLQTIAPLATPRSDKLYGELINFRALLNAPTEELGVIFLFGMVARELGFYIESIHQGFPDAEAKYLRDKKKRLWARARIEFEFNSASFLEHNHDPALCNFIVCWQDDWKDCPSNIRVIELQSEIRKLPSK